VAEEFRLEQGFRYAGAVDRDQRPAASGTVFMDESREQFLAHSALTRDENFESLRATYSASAMTSFSA
jgi:hypothetical protein